MTLIISFNSTKICPFSRYDHLGKEDTYAKQLLCEILKTFGYSRYICKSWMQYPAYVKHVNYFK